MCSLSLVKLRCAFGLVLTSLIIHATASTFNCSEPPNFANFDVNGCCRVPEINLGNAPEKCDTYVNALKTQVANGNGNGSPDGTNINNNNSNNNNRNRNRININNNDATLDDYPSYTHVCYPECIYRETGSLVDDEIQMENVRKFLNKNVSRRDRDIVPHIVRSFETCLSNIRGHMQAVGIKMYTKLPQGCSPYASMIYSCVNAETFLHCPAKMWKNERYCNLAKSFATQCNPLPHVPLPIV